MIYRLNGDWNPLHINPKRAAVAGYNKPILHGLCSFGIVGRVIYDTYCNNNPLKLKKLNTRFTYHIFPGDTLQINLWKEGNMIIFEVKVIKSGKIAIIG